MSTPTSPLSGALLGIRVVSLAINLPGPLAVSRLAALGAEVIKVQPPTGDPLAGAATGWYSELHEKVKVVTLDLKQDHQRAVLDELLADADVLVTAQRPSALVRLGLSKMTEQFPRLVHIEIIGHDGDRAEEPGHDLTYQAAHGTLTPPTLPTVPVADLLGAERAATTAIAALVARGADGPGGRHRVTLEDAACLAGKAVRHGLMGPGAPLGGASPTYRIYAAADGHMALGALEPHFAARVHEHIGTTFAELKIAFASRQTAHWEELATRLDLPLVRITQSIPTREVIST
ncbi:2-octaprenyl-3-methyl-6-methoxy-1,4-benzoquinol hydroxylase [Nocardioides sp. Soil797]|nr:2-octaprenyl-3-methyl-6-methoxy-1,4-benzoquinol hydroxylase [Nocardioides sp. Soil797]